MINLNLTIQEIETVLKHIEQSAVNLMDKIRGQAHVQVQALAQQSATTEEPATTPAESTTNPEVTN